MEKIRPHSDDKMLYNEKTKKYELTLSYVKGEYGNPFGDDKKLRSRIVRNTQKVYNYIFSHTHALNINWVYSFINETEEYREWIFQALDSQIMADLASGYNDNTLYVEDRRTQYMNQVSVDTENILKASQGYGGINLLCMYPIVVL